MILPRVPNPHTQKWLSYMHQTLLAATTCAILSTFFLLILPGSAQSQILKNECKVRKGHQGSRELDVNLAFSKPPWRASVDKLSKFIAVSHINNTARIFDTNTMQLIKTIYFPLRKEEARRARAIVFGPNSELLAYSTPPLRQAVAPTEIEPDTGCLYIYDIKKEQNVVLLKTMTRVQAVRFSPDGKYLAATLSDGHGLRVWETTNWTLYYSDDGNYDQVPNASECKSAPKRSVDLNTTGLIFGSASDADAWIVTAGDTGVRIYGHAVKNALDANARHDTRPTRLKSSTIGLCRPSGIDLDGATGHLAVGDRRNPKLAIIDIKRKSLLRNLSLSDFALSEDSKLSALYRSSLGSDRIRLSRVSWLRRGGRLMLIAGDRLPCLFLNQKIVRSSGLSGEQEPIIKNILFGKTLDISQCVAVWDMSNPDASQVAIRIGTQTIMDIHDLPSRNAIAILDVRQLKLVRGPGKSDFGLSEAPNSTLALLGADGKPIKAGDHTMDLRSQPNGGVDWRSPGFKDAKLPLGDRAEFRMSPDGSIVYFNHFLGSQYHRGYPLRLSLKELDLIPLPLDRVEETLLSPDRGHPFVANWMNKLATGLRINEQQIHPANINADEISRSISVRRDIDGKIKQILWVTSDFIRLLDNNGREICQRKRIRTEAFRANLSANGKIAIIGHGDGFIRWYRLNQTSKPCTFELLLETFIYRDRPRGKWKFVSWTPAGKFFAEDLDDGAPLGRRWHTGPANGKFISSLEYHDADYRKDAIQEALDPTTIPDPEGGKAIADRRLRRLRIDIELINSSKSEFHGQDILLKVHVRRRLNLTSKKFTDDQLNRLAINLKLQINGIRAKTARLKVSNTSYSSETDSIRIVGPGPHTVKIRFPKKLISSQGPEFTYIRLSPEQNKIAPASIRLKWKEGVPRPSVKRRLFAILVGNSNYGKELVSTPFAQNDVVDFAKIIARDYSERVMKKNITKLPADFEKIDLTLLLTPMKFTSDPQLAELEDLSKSLTKTTKESRVSIHKAGPNGLTRDNRSLKKIFVDSLKNIRKRINSGQGDWDDLLLIYFSGHGVMKVESGKQSSVITYYLLFPGYSENNPDTHAPSALSDRELAKELESIPAYKKVVLDACQNSTSRSRNNVISPSHLVQRLAESGVHYAFSGAPAGKLAFGQSFRTVEDMYHSIHDENLHNSPRAAGERGNGLFSAEYLRGVIDPLRSPDYVIWTSSGPIGRAAIEKRETGWRIRVRDIFQSTHDKLSRNDKFWACSTQQLEKRIQACHPAAKVRPPAFRSTLEIGTNYLEDQARPWNGQDNGFVFRTIPIFLKSKSVLRSKSELPACYGNSEVDIGSSTAIVSRSLSDAVHCMDVR